MIASILFFSIFFRSNVSCITNGSLVKANIAKSNKTKFLKFVPVPLSSEHKYV